MRRGKMVDRRVLSMSGKISRRLVAEGAVSVVLAGSWVRGDAHEGSDIDLWAVGKKSTYHLELVSGFLVAVSQRTMNQFSNEFRDPATLAGSLNSLLNWFIVRCETATRNPLTSSKWYVDFFPTAHKSISEPSCASPRTQLPARTTETAPSATSRLEIFSDMLRTRRSTIFPRLI